MKLPNAEEAVIEDAKLVDYLLSSRHPYGRAKARFFANLGYWSAEPEPLRNALIQLGKQVEMQEIRVAYVKYVGAGELAGPSGRRARVTTVWIIERDGSRPRLVTAYPS